MAVVSWLLKQIYPTFMFLLQFIEDFLLPVVLHRELHQIHPSLILYQLLHLLQIIITQCLLANLAQRRLVAHDIHPRLNVEEVPLVLDPQVVVFLQDVYN